MLKKEDIEEYLKRRAEGRTTPASFISGLRNTQPQHPVGEWDDGVYRWEEDGFELTGELLPSGELEDSSWLGELWERERDVPSKYRGQVRAMERGRWFYVPATPYEELVKYLRANGYSSGNADYLACQDIQRDYKRLRELYDGHWSLCDARVRVSLDGHVLGMAYLGAVESDADEDYAVSVFHDIAPEALDEAKEAAKALAKRLQKIPAVQEETKPK